MDASRRAADVERLASVLLHVGTLDADPEALPVEDNLGPAVVGDRFVVLGDLVVLRHVRIEVVLPSKAAPLGNRAVQREPDAYRRLDRLVIDDR